MTCVCGRGPEDSPVVFLKWVRYGDGPWRGLAGLALVALCPCGRWLIEPVFADHSSGEAA